MFDSDLEKSALVTYCVEQSALFMITINKQGLIQDACHYALDLTGRPLKGLPFKDILVDFSNEFSLDALAESESKPVLLNIATGNGLPQTLYFRFKKLPDGFLVIGEQNSLEIEVLRQNLTSLNQEAANLNRELQKKNAELNKLNDIKNQFVGMAAHDLRNPIGGIYSLSQFLLEHSSTKLSDEQREILSMINVSSNFMLRLLDDLLTIAKMELGKLNLDLQTVDLRPYIRRIVKLNQLLAERKKVHLQLQDYDTLPAVVCDPIKIEQVLNNLISNAVKFSPDGQTVEINLFRNVDQVIFTVCDRGPGIPDEDTDKIFKPFSKIGVKLPEGEQSTGLGLSIAHKIVIGHMGSIWYQKRPGGGSSFCFSLPLNRSMPPAAAKTEGA